MKHENMHFRHQSLQDRDTIAELLLSVQRGLSKGKLSFTDDQNTITLEPSGLLNLTIEASANSELNVLDVRVTWQEHKLDSVSQRITVSTDE